MPKYRYRPIPSVIEEQYLQNTNQNIYEHIGQVDFSHAKLLVVAENEEECEKIRKGFSDVRMWELESVED